MDMLPPGYPLGGMTTGGGASGERTVWLPKVLLPILSLTHWRAVSALLSAANSAASSAAPEIILVFIGILLREKLIRKERCRNRGKKKNRGL
jgi:hypothetical protein